MGTNSHWRAYRKTNDALFEELWIIDAMEPEHRHQCFSYEGAPSKQLPTLAAVLRKELDEGHRCLYLNSRPMITGIRSFLSSLGVDVVNEISQGRLILSSESIESPSGGFDIERMLQKLEDELNLALSDEFKGLWATGDMTWELGSERDFTKLMEYEYRLEELFCKRSELSGICQYHQDTLPPEATKQALRTHRVLFICPSLNQI